MNASFLGALAGAVAILSMALWVVLLKKVRIPRNRLPFLATFTGAGVLGLYALSQDANWLGNAGAAIAFLLAIGNLALRAQSAQAAVQPSVSVGGKILDFTAPDDEDKPFTLSSLQGGPFLLKFFRGHW